MIYSIFANKDATLNEQYPEMNTGLDEVLTIEKIASSSVSPVTYNSRAIVHFDIDWPALVGLGMPIASGSRAAYLNMYVTEEKNIGADYELVADAVGESWDQGLGRESHSPKTSEGASWKYRNKTQQWGSWGGSEWFGSGAGANPFAQSFNDKNKDLRLDVSKLTADWSSSNINIDNNGFVVMRSGSQEWDGLSYGSVQFFGKNTHTIYQPKLEICWEDATFNTGSLTALNMYDPEDNFFYIKSNRGEYTKNSKVRFTIRGRKRYHVKTYQNKSEELKIKIVDEISINAGVPMTYAIIDAKTGEAVIPHATDYTQLSCHASRGMFFEFYTNGLSEDRYYTVQLKYTNGTDLAYYNLKETFRVVR